MNNNQVSIARINEGESVTALVKRTLNHLQWPLPEGLSGTIVIKPNLLVPRPAESGATTSPEMVKALVELAYSAGAGKVIIAESSNWGVPTDVVFESLGYANIARETGCELVNIKSDKLVEVEVDSPFMRKFLVPETLLMADYLINAPKLKTHRMTWVTFGLKNLAVGSMDDDHKEIVHRIGLYPAISDELMAHGSGLDYNIVAINLALRCDLTVIDGIVGQEGPGAPLTGNPVNSGLLIAGTDRVGVDAVTCQLVGIDPLQVQHITLAAKAGLGHVELDKIQIVGDPVSECYHPYATAIDMDPTKYANQNIKIVIGKACHGCLGTVSNFLQRHMGELEEVAPVTIFVGKLAHQKPDAERRRLVYYGNCAGDNIYGGGFVSGCPPRSRRQVFQALGAVDLYTPDEDIKLDR